MVHARRTELRTVLRPHPAERAVDIAPMQADDLQATTAGGHGLFGAVRPGDLP
ncbi:hypothetical protein [Streptomyces sp. WAC01526]|uniref:hypothetical protein n=1 Tax=Streptomyces sp. WAC01526 TaxID=2588709 RepID=UPI001CA31B03|nr:hypothetical protein [Streptomyces sp. WAC01526]